MAFSEIQLMNRLRLIFAICAVGFSVMASAHEAETSPATFLYSEGQSEIGHLKRFHWKVLEAALERTRKSYGDYRLIATPAMPMSRQEYELTQGRSAITVAVFNSNADRVQRMMPVRIPIDRGLLSFRVLLIRRDDQPRFDRINSLNDLKAISFGLLPWWDDVGIMRAAGLTIVGGDSYDGLFHMLSAGRFDAFSRGLSEAEQDFERMSLLMPSLALERHLLLHYPLPVYFWFSNTAAGRMRADRVRAGLSEMVADGTLREMVDAHYEADLAALHLSGRQIIELSNPLLDGQDPMDQPSLWYHP